MPSTTQSGGRVSFRDLPKTYEALCALYLPRPIRSRSARAEALRYIEALTGYDLNRDQEDYLATLTHFVHEYEQRSVSVPELEPLELLKHLLEENGYSVKDLAGILGVDQSLASRLLSGSRSITPAHAKRLGQQFGMRPGIFLGLP
jgi:HTH-type transcriptional regulator / antitoxin HigA